MIFFCLRPERTLKKIRKFVVIAFGYRDAGHAFHVKVGKYPALLLAENSNVLRIYEI